MKKMLPLLLATLSILILISCSSLRIAREADSLSSAVKGIFSRPKAEAKPQAVQEAPEPVEEEEAASEEVLEIAEPQPTEEEEAEETPSEAPPVEIRESVPLSEEDAPVDGCAVSDEATGSPAWMYLLTIAVALVMILSVALFFALSL